MNKKEILETISNYLDTIQIRDWTEWIVHTNTMYLQFNRDSYSELSEKYNLKWWDTITKQMRIEIDTIIWRKLWEFYEKNKDNMPWNN